MTLETTTVPAMRDLFRWTGLVRALLAHDAALRAEVLSAAFAAVRSHYLRAMAGAL